MGSVATSLAVVAREKGQEAADRFKSYLNQNVAPNVGINVIDPGLEINETVSISEANSRSQALTLGLEKWEVGGDYNTLTPQWSSDERTEKGTVANLDELYAIYQASRHAASGEEETQSLKSPTGNLVDTVA